MKLLRPYIPIENRLRVVARQLGTLWIDDLIKQSRGKFRALLDRDLAKLADLLGCEKKEMHLDHNPPLGARKKIFKNHVHVEYDPPANSVAHLAYRPHGAQFEGSHDIKTRIRGDHGQYSDLALIKRERKRLNKKANKKRHKWRSRPLQSANNWPKRGFK